MTKRIKAVKCPQCGSTRAKELRPDYYKCSSCQTEFFIDSDDININHKYENPLNKKFVGMYASVLGEWSRYLITFKIGRAHV